jgi:hypothetical protein
MDAVDTQHVPPGFASRKSSSRIVWHRENGNKQNDAQLVVHDPSFNWYFTTTFRRIYIEMHGIVTRNAARQHVGQ